MSMKKEQAVETFFSTLSKVVFHMHIINTHYVIL